MRAGVTLEYHEKRLHRRVKGRECLDDKPEATLTAEFREVLRRLHSQAVRLRDEAMGLSVLYPERNIRDVRRNAFALLLPAVSAILSQQATDTVRTLRRFQAARFRPRLFQSIFHRIREDSIGRTISVVDGLERLNSAQFVFGNPGHCDRLPRQPDALKLIYEPNQVHSTGPISYAHFLREKRFHVTLKILAPMASTLSRPTSTLQMRFEYEHTTFFG